MRMLYYLRELNDALKDWEKYQSISSEEFRDDRDKRNMVLHARHGRHERAAAPSHVACHKYEIVGRYWKYDV